MKVSQICILALIAHAGCEQKETATSNPQEPANPSASVLFTQAIERGEELVFIDAAEVGPTLDDSSLKLTFRGNSRLIMESAGYNFGSWGGTYRMHPNQEVTLDLPGQEWPILVLSAKGDQFALNRKDGLRSYKGHWNLYPEAAENLFPLTTRTEFAEQGEEVLNQE